MRRSTNGKAELEFSDDYQTIAFEGQPLYHLTPLQAEIVKLLHQGRYYKASSLAVQPQTTREAFAQSRCAHTLGNMVRNFLQLVRDFRRHAVTASSLNSSTL